MHDNRTDTTHSPVCWSWGPRHYECALREIERLRAGIADEAIGAYARTLRLADEYATLLICSEGLEIDRGRWKLTGDQVEYGSYLKAAYEHLKWRGFADVTPINDGLIVDFTADN